MVSTYKRFQDLTSVLTIVTVKLSRPAHNSIISPLSSFSISPNSALLKVTVHLSVPVARANLCED
jgi:hypothetical protein